MALTLDQRSRPQLGSPLTAAPEHGPTLIAHRFGRSLGPDSSRATLARLDWSTVGGVETDCCLTRDGGIVLLHDDLLPTGTDLDGWAHDRTNAELLGGRVRTRTGELTEETVLGLDEALTLLGDRAQVIQLEVKATADVALAERTAAALCARRDVRELSDRIEIISFWPPAVEVAARAGLRTRLIVAAAYAPDAFARWASAAGVTGVILEGPYWAAEPVELWRAAGLSVMSGLVNDPEVLARVLAFAPDHVATDRPHELFPFLQAAAHG